MTEPSIRWSSEGAATVISVDNSDLSNVTVESSGGVFTIGVYASGAGALIRNVSILSNNSASGSYGVYATSSAAVALKNTSIDSEISGAVYGIYADFSSKVRCDRCEISVASGGSADYALFESGSTIDVGASLIQGPISANAGAIHCPASYDENYTAKAGC